jgi:1L-myo-inositol 1-phosphate cytidylyltransferase / CDP-L-myo-inositol myo-inositolphosphotransferase
MPEPPILVLLAPSPASADAGDVARGPDGDPIILGLNLIQRAALAARRAGYGQVFLLEPDARGSNQGRHCDPRAFGTRGEAIQGSVGSPTIPGLLRRPSPSSDGRSHERPTAPRNDGSVRARHAPSGTDLTTPGAAAIANWRDLATVLSSHTEPVIIAPAAILAETDWLERLASTRIEPAAWAAIPKRIVMLAAASVLGAVDELDRDGGAQDQAAVEGRLAERFGSPAAISADIDPMVVERPADVRAAERRLLRSQVKDTDGFMARHVERPISLQISRRLAGTAITPNQMSLISIAVGICGGPFFLSSRPLMQTIGALLFLAHSILDGCDGELARLKFQQSRWGGVLDFWGDNVVHTVIFGCMAIGWSLSAAAIWPLWLGAAAVIGTLGSAGFVYWRLMRLKDGGDTLFTSVSDAPERLLTRLLDGASRRDFIYLVILLALFGRSNWFLALAGIGAPIYFLLVLLAARPQASVEGGGSRVAPGANQ